MSEKKVDDLLEAVAVGILTDAEADKGLDRRIDAFKAVSTWRLGVARINGKVPEEQPQDTGLPAFRRRVEEATQEGE